MAAKASRKRLGKPAWPRKIRLGQVVVTIYRRSIPTGGFGYMVANYANGMRRFDSYATEVEALEEAHLLARQLSGRQVVAASMTNEQAAEYAAAIQSLKPCGVTLLASVDAVTECLKIVSDLSVLRAAAKFYAASNKSITRKSVAEVATELIRLKETRQARPRYLRDLRARLPRFAKAFRKDCCDVTTPDVQAWLDDLKLSAQSYMNFRRVIHMLFVFAVARGYASDNPVVGTEKRKTTGGETEIYSPSEIRKLLAAAEPDFLPYLAIGAFAGLRISEIERLEWSDVHLVERHIVITKDVAKTASRRIVPIHENLAAWLTPYAAQTGLVCGSERWQKAARRRVIATSGIQWKHNALRHSYASYRFAQIGNASSVAGELGNSAAIMHKHYRELVKPADAEKWFNVKPHSEARNIVAMIARKE